MNNRDVFNQIAQSWYNFRHHTIFRRELEAMANSWGRGCLVNLGCGHGPDFLPFKEAFELHGMDASIEMLKLARKYSIKYHFYANLVNGDLCHLPYADAVFDHAIAVATYHHLNKEQLPDALRELQRVLKPGGNALITVWNRRHPKFWFHRSNALVPWRTKEKTLYRYYHLFTYGELARAVRAAGFKTIKIFPESKYRFPIKSFSRNICTVVQKKEDW